MKLIIKIKEITEGCMPEIIDKGDWIDLKSADTYELKGKHTPKMVSLGVAMQLPEGYEAVVLPRSSSFKNFGFMQTNSQGVIDCSYNGDTDEWKLPLISVNKGTINKGDRVCQFRIQLSQKATIWQKIKWLFTNKIELIKVDSLNNKTRGGFGSTGVK